MSKKTLYLSFFTVISGIAMMFYFDNAYYYIVLWSFLLIPVAFRCLNSIASLVIIRMGLPLLISIASIIACDIVSSANLSFIEGFISISSHDVMSPFFQIISTLFAICLAFTLWKAMQDFDELRNMLRDEANKIQSITLFLDYFADLKDKDSSDAVREIRAELMSYIERVTDFCNPDVSNENSNRLRACVHSVEKVQTEKKNDEIAIENVMTGLADLTMIRSRRISAMENRMSPFLLFILGLMSFCIVAYFIFDGSDVNAIITPVVSYIFSFLMLTLIDLDHPFDGYWAIKIKAFDDIHGRLDDELGGVDEPHVQAAA